MKHNLVIAVSVLLAAAPVGRALSQGAAAEGVSGRSSRELPSPETLIERHDRDGDGKLSRAEFHTSVAHFAAVDANHDGFLTVEEFREFRRHAARRRGMRRPGQAGSRGVPRRACSLEHVPPSPGGKFIVDVYSPDCMFKGTTLFAANDRDKTSHIVEVDTAGRVVWSLTPSDLMYVPRNLQVMDVERLPSGNTLFNIKNYGAFEVTHDRKLVWKVLDNGISHDVDRLPNGDTLFVRGWVAKGQDLVREVNPAGKIVWSWNGLAQYDRPPFADNDEEGWMHTNAVTRLASGDTMISLRNIDRTVFVDPAGKVVHELRYGRRIPPERRAKVKKKRGSSAIFRPHDPELEADGHIVVASPATNRVLEVTKSGAVVRTIGRWDPKSDRYGVRDANRLPNGNTLIVGFFRIFEVGPDGQIVWSLHRKGVAPSGHAADTVDASHGSYFYKAQRIAPDGTVYGH